MCPNRKTSRMIRLGRSLRMAALFCMIAIATSDRTAAWETLNQVVIPENTAVISSAANKKMHLSYLTSVWKEIEISPGENVALPCQNGMVQVAYSNGSSVRRASLVKGTRYVVFFDDTRQQWSIDTLDSLLNGSLK